MRDLTREPRYMFSTGGGNSNALSVNDNSHVIYINRRISLRDITSNWMCPYVFSGGDARRDPTGYYTWINVRLISDICTILINHILAIIRR